MSDKFLLNNFATRCFRETADQDYIAARLAYRFRLIPQFHWQALQALEKYLKAILLYNRIKAKNVNHDLSKALAHCEKLPFEIKLSNSTQELIKHIDTFGRFRYLETAYFTRGPKLVQLDKAVWEIRRYCKVLDYDLKLANGKTKEMLDLELAAIESSENRPPQKFRIPGGLLEKIVDNLRHESRPALIWQNAFYGKRARRIIKAYSYLNVENAPLTLHPEMLDEVLEYVFLPAEVVKAYRKEIAKWNNLKK